MPGLLLLAVRIAMAIVLYAFLGWALWLLWQELRRSPLPEQPAPRLILTSAGPESGCWQFDSGDAIIGRNAGCDLRLDNPTVSARHARLLCHAGHWWVEDLRSRNGSFLNELALSGPQALRPGDQLRCGNVVIKISLDSQEDLPN